MRSFASLLRYGVVGFALASCTLAIGCSADDGSADPEAVASGDDIRVSKNPLALIDVPFYFAMPKTALSGPLNRAKYSYPTVWNPTREEGLDELGLRVIAVGEDGEPGSKERRAVRRRMSKELAVSGTMQDGDIVLSFRPGLADTMAYPHLQMGSTHAGMVITRGEGTTIEALNLDQPLDTDYNAFSNGKFAGQFDSMHYVGCVPSDAPGNDAVGCKKDSRGEFTTEGGVEALHILRPRNLDERRRANLREWVDVLGGAHARIRAAGGLNFNSDYLKPLLANPAYKGSLDVTVTKLGKILLGLEEAPQDFDMFCSELVFHLLALSNCTADEIRAAGETAACAEEQHAPFKPMLLVDPTYAGLADGPLLGLFGTRASLETQKTLLESTFAGGNAPLSSGHRAVAEAVAPLMAGIKQYYTDRIECRAADDSSVPAYAQINAMTGNVRNYSPTAFLVNAALAQNDPLRSIDYVATVVFTPRSAMEKAKTLSRNPVP